MDLTYVGPHDAVDVEYPPGVPLGACARGHNITVPDEAALGLLEQGTDHWIAAGTDGPIRTHQAANSQAAALGIEFADGTKLAEKVAAIAAARGGEA